MEPLGPIVLEEVNQLNLVVDENDATTPTAESALQPKVLNSNDEGVDEEKDVENSEEEEAEEEEEQ